MSESQYQIYDAEQKRRYYAQIPNIIDDLELSIFAVRLYLRFKRAAGESGECYQGITKLAKECQMSRTSVIKARKELQERGLIVVSPKKNPDGGKDTFSIVITDIWDKNIEIYDRMKENKKVNGFYVNAQGSNIDLEQSPNIDLAKYKFEPCKVHIYTEQGTNLHLKNIEYKRNGKEKEAPKNGAGGSSNSPEQTSTDKKEKDSTKKKKALDFQPGSLEFLPSTVRSLGVAFLEEAGAAYAPIQADVGLWRKVLNEWAARGFTVDIVKLAIRDMRKSKLTISGPQSITKVGCSIKGGLAKDNTRIYHAGDMDRELKELG